VRAERRIKTTLETEFAKTVRGYNSVTPVSAAVSVKKGKVSYSLFPVWTLNTKYQDENYTFMMNGQTGLLAGKLPVDKGKLWKYRGLFTGIIGAILTPLIFILGQLGVIAGAAALLAGVALDATPEELSSITAVAGMFTVTLALVLLGWAAAGATGFFVVRKWEKNMDTAKLKTQAAEYMIPGSLKLKIEKDKYLYSNTTRVPIPKAGGGRRR
jgi:hypothetical protein